MKKPRPDPTNQIKEEIRNMAEEIFDIIAKDPEKEHVPGDVQEARMKKHTGDQWQEGYFEAGVSGQEGGEAGRHCGVGEEQGVKRPMRERGFESEIVNETRNVGKEKRDLYKRMGTLSVQGLYLHNHSQHPPTDHTMS